MHLWYNTTRQGLCGSTETHKYLCVPAQVFGPCGKVTVWGRCQGCKGRIYVWCQWVLGENAVLTGPFCPFPYDGLSSDEVVQQLWTTAGFDGK